LESREAVFALLAEALDEGRGVHARGGELPVLTAEGLVGAAVAILCKRLVTRDREPLSELLDPLMSMIVLPYLGSAAAGRERTGRIDYWYQIKRSLKDLGVCFSLREMC
jgi:hypothetical protein